MAEDQKIEGTSADAAVTTPVNPPDGASDQRYDDESYRNVKEIQKALVRVRELREQVRDMRSSMTSTKDEEPPQRQARNDEGSAMAEVNKLRAEIAMERVFGEIGIKPGSKQRELLEAAVEARRPKDVAAFVRGYVESFKIESEPATKRSPVDTGPATRTSDGTIPKSPAALTKEMVQALGSDGLVKHYQDYKAQHGISHNPFAAKKPK